MDQVRVGTLPTRLMALRHGADIVYSPEIIDRRLSKSRRVENVLTGTIDYVDEKDGSLTLRIHPSEKSRLVVQLGSSDPENAVLAARRVQRDVAGIDLNCGCPKKFSVVSCMGSALLSEPDRLVSILRALVSNIPLPITCKLRMLPTLPETVALVQRIATTTGVSAIAMHCRYRVERPEQPGHWDVFAPVGEVCSAHGIPLIANGDLFAQADVARMRAGEFGAVSSFMMARAAESNISVFRTEGPRSISEVIPEYIRLALEYDMPFHNAKYVCVQMWSGASTGERKNRLGSSRSFRELCACFDMEEEYDEVIKARLEKATALGRLDLLSKEVQGVLGPDCPYIPNAPYIPTKSNGFPPVDTAARTEESDVDVVDECDLSFSALRL
ncbi:tRNA-dihydrouridine(20) synthase [NAD(P)+]-like [Irineochytrium annulatum]|nr:tRNA-dihydrouridine(20) synthase [NAD(P)+]-like [Irineochytrium annulatum]